MRRYITLSLLLSMMALNACGTRGSLYLPPQQKTTGPATGPPNQVDLSTAKTLTS